MKTIAISDFRSQLKKFFDYVGLGNSLVITSRGQEIARIIPEKDVKEEALDSLKEMAKKSKIKDVTSPINIKWDSQL